MSTPFASTARTMSVSPSPSFRRTATSRVDASGSPNCGRGTRRSWAIVLGAGNRVHARPADLGLQLGRRALRDDLARVDDPDAVRENVGLFEVLGRQEHGHARLAPHQGHFVPDVGSALRVQARRRLVEEEDPRAVDEGERDRAVASSRPRNPRPSDRRRRRDRRGGAAPRHAIRAGPWGRSAASPAGAGGRAR